MSERTIAGVPPTSPYPGLVPPPREPARPIEVERVIPAPVPMRGPVGPGARPVEADGGDGPSQSPPREAPDRIKEGGTSSPPLRNLFRSGRRAGRAPSFPFF